MKRLLFVLILLFTAACGSNSGLGLPDSLISGEPSSELFDVWTFNVEMGSLRCPILQFRLNGIAEEYRIYQTGSGCAISDKAEDGTDLTTDGRLFDDGTTCTAGENSVQLVRNFSITNYFGDDCTNEVNYTVQLELNADSSALIGAVIGSITYSGTCIDTDSEPLSDCEFEDDVTAVRGRYGMSMEPVIP